MKAPRCAECGGSGWETTIAGEVVQPCRVCAGTGRRMSLRIYDELEQRSPEWFEARRGIVTASVVGKLISIEAPAASTVECVVCGAAAGDPCISSARKTPTPIKTFHDARAAVAAAEPPVYKVADNDTSRALTATLAAERVAGFTEETPMNRDMNRGVWSEPFARSLYSEHYEKAVEVGFMRRDEDAWSLGLSPDGLVGADGGLEIKAPRAKTHVLWTLADRVPDQHMAQVQAALLVTGRKWWDFMSYVGGMPVFIKRVWPDPEWFAVIEAACRAFEASAAAMVTNYESRVFGRPVAPRIDFDLEVI